MIIKNPLVWDESYLPERILYREEALSREKQFLSSLLKKRPRTENLLCVGDYGTGKTVCTRYVLSEIESKTKKEGILFKYFYINCAEYSQAGKSVTVGRIITRCLKNEGYKIYPTLPIEFKLGLLENFSKKLDSLIIFLDEVDYYLSHKRNDFETLAYIISRSLPNASLVLATNKFWIYDYLNDGLDSRVQDTFSKRLKVISFGDYTEDELFGILLDRAKIGFEKGSYSRDVLEYIAYLSYQNGWRARGVINIARRAAELAESKGEDIITYDHADEIVNEWPKNEFAEIIKRLDPPALNILQYLVRKGGKAKEGEILDWFKEKAPEVSLKAGRSRATFYNALSRLKGMEIVESKVMGKGRGKGQYALLEIKGAYFDLMKEAIEEIIKA